MLDVVAGETMACWRHRRAAGTIDPAATLAAIDGPLGGTLSTGPL